MGQGPNKGRKWLNPDLIAKHPAMNIALMACLKVYEEHKSVAGYIEWLNRELNCDCLDKTSREGIFDRLISSSNESYEEALAELVYIALWNRLDWQFRKDPKAGIKTPDFGVWIAPQETFSFFAEATVVRHDQNHHHTFLELDENRIWVDGSLVDKLPIVKKPIEQDHRIGMKIAQKAHKYKGMAGDLPLVICIFIRGFENNFYMGRFQVENAIYGQKTIAFPSGEIFFKPKIKATEHNKKACVGIFAFEEYKHVNSLLVCRERILTRSSDESETGQEDESFKVAHEFIAYANPLSAWAHVSNNPLAAAGLPVYGLIDQDQPEPVEPKTIEFY